MAYTDLLMWFFGKDKKSKGNDASKEVVKADAPAAPLTSKQQKTQELMAQMRTLRAEIGEENLEKMVQKLKLDSLKKQIRDDIDNDPKKRDRLLDEIRFHIQDDNNSTRH